jgi:hypothetical protein
MGPDSIVDKPGGPKPWSERARRSWQAWRNCYPSLAYARGDPHTFYVDIDRAADMAGLTRANFYRRYLLSNQLPYVVKTWFHGHRRRYKSFIPRNALLSCWPASFARSPGCTRRAAVGRLSSAKPPRLIWSDCSTRSFLNSVNQHD